MKNIFSPCFNPLTLLLCLTLTATVSYAQSTFHFIENKGQVHDQNDRSRTDVLFSCENQGVTYHFEERSVSYQLIKSIGPKEPRDLQTRFFDPHACSYNVSRIDVKWLNANPSQVVSEGVSQEVGNFYTGGNNQHLVRARYFSGLLYKNIYPSVDLHYFTDRGRVKYDFIVSPGGDYRSIKLEISGAEKIFINENGAAIVRTPLGDLVEEKPLVIQEGKILPSRWVIENNVLSFDIEGVDPDRVLLIDPVTRLWGTYYGTDYGPRINFCTTDPQGYVYVGGGAGITPIALATSGSHQSTVNGNYDAFFAKFDPMGNRLWATFFGGKGSEMLYCGTADAYGNLYLGGMGDSLTNATPGAHQTKYGGYFGDGLVMKFTTAGILQWATHYGEGSHEQIRGIATDRTGNVFFCGNIGGYQIPISSGTAIATPGSYQSAISATNACFLAKFNALGQRQWATFYSNQSWGAAESCAADSAGNVYLIGRTVFDSVNFISTPGSHQPNYGGSNDGFIAKFSPNGTRLWGTYYGGTGDEYVFAGACDKTGNVFIVGWTQPSPWHTHVLTTPGSLQPVYSGSGDAFITKFSSSGARLWGTYYGDYGHDGIGACHVDSTGNITVVGNTSSTTKIATLHSHQFTKKSYYDCFVAQLNPNGGLNWGTYYGGKSDRESATSVSISKGNIYVSGWTESKDSISIATPGSLQPLWNDTIGGTNNFERAFLVRFNDCNTVQNFPSTTSNTSTSGPCGFSPTLSVVWTPTVNWYTTPTGGSSIGSGTPFMPGSLPAGSYMFYAQSKNNCPTTLPRVGIPVNIEGCVGLEETEFEPGEVIIYPNPVDNNLTIELTETSSCKLYDALGKEIYFVNLNAGANTLDLSSLEPGFYFIQMTTGNKAMKKKLVVL